MKMIFSKEAFMNEGQRMIEMARKAHQQRQKAGLPYWCTNTNILDISAATKRQSKKEDVRPVNDSEVLNQLIHENLSVKEIYSGNYTTMVVATLCFMLANEVKRIFILSGVKATKAKQILYKARKKWEKQLVSPYAPKDLERDLFTLAWWWMDDGLRPVVDSLHYANVQEVMKKTGYNGNEADIFGWVLTIRDMVNAIHRKNYEYEMRLIEATLTTIRVNRYEAVIDLLPFCDSIVDDGISKGFKANSDSVVVGRRALYNKFISYNPFEFVAQANSQEIMEETDKECPEDRCKNCSKYPCKVYKGVIKALEELSKNIN